MVQVTVWLHTDEFIFVWFYENENSRQNRSSGANTDIDGRAPQLSARVNHGTPAAGLIGHILSFKICIFLSVIKIHQKALKDIGSTTNITLM